MFNVLVHVIILSNIVTHFYKSEKLLDYLNEIEYLSYDGQTSYYDRSTRMILASISIMLTFLLHRRDPDHMICSFMRTSLSFFISLCDRSTTYKTLVHTHIYYLLHIKIGMIERLMYLQHSFWNLTLEFSVRCDYQNQ